MTENGMSEREKVIKGLEMCQKKERTGFSCFECPYAIAVGERDDWCIRGLYRDALALLKEQEAREPHYTTLRYLVNGMEVAVHHPECPRCIENGLLLWDAEIEKGQAYCKRCGQAVKWE